MASLITLYDIPSTLPIKAWSPNTWKTRYSLNYKGIPYKTVWVEFPDIEALCKEIGAKPTSTKLDGSPLYTLPAIYDPSTNTAVSDSPNIAAYLDATYPSTPVLFPANTHALQYAFVSAFANLLRPLFGMATCASNTHLNPASGAFFRRTKEPLFGASLEDLSPVGPKRDSDWKEVKKCFDSVNGWLEKNGEKPYVMGDTITYADIVLVSFIKWIPTVMGRDGKEWEDLQTWHGGRWKSLVDSFEKYAAVTE